MIGSIKQWVAGKALSALGLAFARGDDLELGTGERLTEPYRRSAWVRSAIDKISGPVASVPVEFFAAGSSGEKRVRMRRRAGRITRVEGEEIANPALDGFLREPMAGMMWGDFVEANVAWLRLAGEVFWILTDEMMVPFPEVRNAAKVVVARPDRMRHVVVGGVLEGWVWTDAAGRQITLDLDQVIHLKQYNPYDPFRGLGQFESALVAAESDYLAGKFARNLMANNGDTGPYIVAKNGIPSGEQREQILMDLRAKRSAQARGVFRPVFLGGDITIEDPKIQSVDAGYIAERIENRHEVYVALGVPPSMADVKAAYSIGSASDFYQLILNTCIPAGDKLCDGLERVAERVMGARVMAYLDWDEHPVMQEVRKERLASVDVLWNKGMPMAEVSEYLSLGLPEYEGDDVGYLPFGVVAVGEMNAPTEDPALAEEPTDVPPAGDVVGEMVRALQSRSRLTSAATECGCGCSLEAGDMDARRDAREIAQWKTLMSARRGTMKAYESRINRELFRARSEVLRKIESAQGKMLVAVGKAVAADFLFDLGRFAQSLTATMRGVGMTALQTAGDQVYKELRKDDVWKMPPGKALDFLRQRDNRIVGASEEIFAQVKASLEEGIQDGDTMAELAGRVRGQFNKLSNGRAWTIASTETGAAYGVARQEAMRSAGVQFKRWLTSGNSNVRAAHAAMNGAVVPIDEDFAVIDPKTGEMDRVSHPGDSQGAAWNVINCHCVSVAEQVKEGNDE